MEMATLNHYSGQEQTPYLFQVANKFWQSARVMPWLGWPGVCKMSISFTYFTNVCTHRLHSVP